MAHPNVFEPAFDEDVTRYEEHGFRCRRSRLGYQAGCERLGVSLWEIEPGSEGVEHYHFGNEELLIVLSGRPSLRTPAGWRELAEGEVAAFPRGPDGAHAVGNHTQDAARVLFFSEMRGPDLVVYPELGMIASVEKMSSPERGGMAVWTRLEGAIELHDPAPPNPASNPAVAADRANALAPDFDTEQSLPGFSWRAARLAAQAGAKRLGASLYELPPEQTGFPYHAHLANEEMLVVVRGRPSLRTPDGWRPLGEGEVVSFPTGEKGAHQVTNRSEEPARFLMVSEMRAPDVVLYPDSEKVGARGSAPGSGGSGLRMTFRSRDAVDYWEGEDPPSENGK